MSETTVSDVVSMAFGGDSTGVKSGINDILQQKIMVALENKKKNVASSLFNRSSAEETVQAETPEVPEPTEPNPTQQEVENG
tara:strand:- start:505 stop:750 length:246 start_codon:yes stop_codon:yes gene_type:complete